MSPLAKYRWRWWALFLLLLVACSLRVWPKAELAAGIPMSRVVQAADGTLLRLTLAEDGQYRSWTPLSQIAPGMIEATLEYEDRYFRWHPGVNPVSLARAIYSTYVRGGRRQGASTITMQLARRLGGIDSRSVGGKLRQILAACWIELRYSKDEILEAYLNLAPYGGNIEGVGAASRILFHKKARALDRDEALTLAVIPQDPGKRGTPLVRGRAWPTELDYARRLLRRRWRGATPGGGQRESPAKATTRPKVHALADLPFRAPHVVDALLHEHQGQALLTTLDPRVQELVERHVKQHVLHLGRLGVRNAVAMLLDSRTMEVKAAVGSADFFDKKISGQVNGTSAKRSPGSALKPFAYALALDQGVIHPNTLLKDTRRAFGAYAPENFDGEFAGPLSATEALIRSRNVPAVTLAGRLNRPSLYSFLETAAVGRLVSEAHHGLGIVLGTAEVSMQELVQLYAMLANDGVLKPLRLLRDSPRGKGARLLSSEASYLVLDMLEKSPRPDASRFVAAVNPLAVAWKTGTSWGFRDAWCVGVFGRFVLAVWVGEFSSESNPAFVGIRAAAPLFFSIADAMAAAYPRPARHRRRRPSSIERVELCALTGALPNRYCRRKKRGWFIPGRSPIHRCTVHRQIAIDVETQRRVCGPYIGRTKKAVYEVWPSDLAQLFAEAGLPRRPLPPPGPGCLVREQDRLKPPRITSPLKGLTYILRASRAKWEPIPLEAEASGDAKTIFWYVGRRLVGRSPVGKRFFWPPNPGKHLIRAVDDRGRSDTRPLYVELVP